VKRALTPNERAFYRGFASAIESLATEFHEPDLAAHIAQSKHVTLTALIAAEADVKSFKAELAAVEERALKKKKDKK
jgi:hypothetical protein